MPERAGLTAAQTRDVHYGYDLRNLQLYARFDSASGEGVTSTYDPFGRLASSSIDMNGVTRTLTYQYDPAGNRIRITHPGGTISFATSYDGLNRPVWLRENGTVPRTAMNYYPGGMPYALGRVNDQNTYWNHDGVQRLSSLAQLYPGPGPLVWWTYARNPAGQIASVTRDVDAFAWTGHYQVQRSYTTNGLNQYTAAGAAAFEYDANGNLISDGTSTFTYDVENRLVGRSGGVVLAYDPLGRLFQVSATTPAAVTTRFLYDGDALVAEYDASGVMTHRYVHYPGADLPQLDYTGATLASPHYLHADHQGSIIAMSDDVGTLAINRYDEYGIPAATNSGRFQYTGQVWLPELGLYYYKARIYSPTLGRFLQVDPIGYDDQFNLYEYVGDDPVNATDPDGRQTALDTQRFQAIRETSQQVVDYVRWVASDLGDLAHGIAQGRFEWALGGLPPTFSGGLSGLSAAPRLAGELSAAANGITSAERAAARAGQIHQAGPRRKIRGRVRGHIRSSCPCRSVRVS